MMDIKEINTLHQEAMARVDLALAARRRHDVSQVLMHFREAYELESTAAVSLANSTHGEPARSVLLRSAAALALNCNLIADAEKLICTALAGSPPAEIAEELRDLLEQVYFKRHLALRGITLEGDEIQMSIDGKAIGFGIAPASTFLGRVGDTEKLLYRTAERKQHKPYHDGGRRQQSLQENVQLFMTAPRAASFAVTFKVGRSAQMSFPGMSIGEQVVDELLECMDMFTRGDETKLRAHIADEAYYQNFVGLARSIAPDGREVSQVGFTILRAGEIREVALTANTENPLLHPKSIAKEPVGLNDSSTETTLGESVQVSGILKMADGLKAESEIQILDGTTRHTIIVPQGMMADIVRPLWEMYVLVTGTSEGNRIRLQDIRMVEPTPVEESERDEESALL